MHHLALDMTRFRLIALCILGIAACDSAGTSEEPPVFSHEIAVTALADTTLDIDAEPLVINLQDVFEHQDGFDLTYATPQLDGTSVTMQVLDSLVTLTPSLHGTTTLRMVASSLDGATATAEVEISIIVPQEVETLVQPGSSLEINAGAHIPFRGFFRQAQDRQLDFHIRTSGSDATNATMVADTAFSLVGPHDSSISFTLVAIDRGRETTLPLVAVLNGVWCPEPPPGSARYFSLTDGQNLDFTLTQGTSSGGPYGSSSTGLKADVTWAVRGVTCGQGVQIYSIEETGQGIYKWNSTGYEPVQRDSSWTNQFSLSVIQDGSLFLTNLERPWHVGLPVISVFQPVTNGTRVELGEQITSNQASRSWNMILDRSDGLMFLKTGRSERWGASGGSSRSFKLERK